MARLFHSRFSLSLAVAISLVVVAEAAKLGGPREVVYEGAPPADCEDCLCLVHYTALCVGCASSRDVLVPCTSNVEGVMRQAANDFHRQHPSVARMANPFRFRSAYSGLEGSRVVSLNGVVAPAGKHWELYLNERRARNDIIQARIKRGGESVVFRIEDNEVRKSSPQRSSLLKATKPTTAKTPTVGSGQQANVREASSNPHSTSSLLARLQALLKSVMDENSFVANNEAESKFEDAMTPASLGRDE